MPEKPARRFLLSALVAIALVLAAYLFLLSEPPDPPEEPTRPAEETTTITPPPADPAPPADDVTSQADTEPVGEAEPQAETPAAEPPDRDDAPEAPPEEPTRPAEETTTITPPPADPAPPADDVTSQADTEPVGEAEPQAETPAAEPPDRDDAPEAPPEEPTRPAEETTTITPPPADPAPPADDVTSQADTEPVGEAEPQAETPAAEPPDRDDAPEAPPEEPTRPAEETTTITPPPADPAPPADDVTSQADTEPVGEESAPGADGIDDQGGTVSAVVDDHPLEFDIVRVDKSGFVTMAGRGTPGSMIRILLNGEEISTAEVGPDGSFAAFFTIKDLSAPVRIQLLEINGDDGQGRSSEDTVLVLAKPPGTGEGTAVVAEADNDPITVLETKDGVELLGPQGTDRELRIDLLTFDRDGAVVVAGRGTPGRALLIYIDNIFVTEVKIAESGSWQVRLPPVTPGQHILRVDQIDEEASVINRLEMQFNPDADTATEEDVIATDGNGRRPPDYTKTELVIVRKGYTLWGISRSKYGLGRLYVTIFEANDHLIKDPDLIYPGQIFIIPK